MNLEIDVSLSYKTESDKIQPLLNFINNEETLKQLLKNGTIACEDCTSLRIQIGEEDIYIYNYTIQMGKTVIQDQEFYITNKESNFETIKYILLKYIKNNLILVGG